MVFKSIFKKIVTAILEFEARVVLARYRPRIVAVTGSVGKTTTKDAAYAVMQSRFSSWKSAKSYNSEIGIPLAVIGEESGWGSLLSWTRVFMHGLALIAFRAAYPKWLVLEAGVDRPGDMGRVTRLIKTDRVILTRLPDVPVHVEYFASKEDVYKEKLLLASTLKKDGVLIVNNDDARLREFASAYTERSVVTYGVDEDAHVRARDVRIHMQKAARGATVPAGMMCTVHFKGEAETVVLYGVLGNGVIYSALAAAALGVSVGSALTEVSSALGAYLPPPGRMRLVPGRAGFMIIDDSYNSSPDALQNALEVLGSLRVKGRKIAVIGDMLELGKYTVSEHEKVGEGLPQGLSHIYLVGPRAEHIMRHARRAGYRNSQFTAAPSADDIVKSLTRRLRAGDVVLIKGSQRMRLERVVQTLMAAPERKSELLVRQGPEWEKR